MRHMAKIEENRRLEKLYNETKHRFGGGGAQIDSRTGRYFRRYLLPMHPYFRYICKTLEVWLSTKSTSAML